MKRILYIVVAVVLFFVPTAVSETVSQKQARQIAVQFFNAAHNHTPAEPKMVWNGRNLTTARLFPPFYVYNSPAGGYVVVSAENKAFPILAYNLKDSFNPDKLGKTEKEFFRSFAKQIEYIRYDGRIPDKAIAAWTNLSQHISDILSARCETTDPVFSIDEASAIIDNALFEDNADAMLSSFYTPGQWNDQINIELEENRTVAAALVDDGFVRPFIIYGKKGDFYRIEMDSKDASLRRLFATEIISDGQFAALNSAPQMSDDDIEEIPFSFMDSYMAGFRAVADADSDIVGDSFIHSDPLILWNGDGHFSVIIPAENVSLARIYNVEGRMIQSRTFRDINKAELDISGFPRGFYFAILYASDGSVFGLKLAR